VQETAAMLVNLEFESRHVEEDGSFSVRASAGGVEPGQEVTSLEMYDATGRKHAGL
jgi:hypothetical protein